MTENVNENGEPDLFGDPEMMKLFMELHSDNPREGPGDDESTIKALNLVTDPPDFPPQPDILDVGCGPGMQTIALANATRGRIIALDIFQHFLDQLNRSAQAGGVGGRIRTVKGSMFELPFEPEFFDLIWSEGAIYIMGFENGLREWSKFLRPGGAIAVSQISWLRDDVKEDQKELYNWWMENCPDIRPIGGNLEIIEKCGYEILGDFTLPESAWWDGYYDSLSKGFERIRTEHRDDPKAAALIDMELEEQQMYRDYSDYYGYEFYVMRKV